MNCNVFPRLYENMRNVPNKMCLGWGRRNVKLVVALQDQMNGFRAVLFKPRLT